MLGKASNHSWTKDVVVPTLVFISVQKLRDVRSLEIGHSWGGSRRHGLYETYSLSVFNGKVYGWCGRDGRSATPGAGGRIHLDVEARARGISHSRVQTANKDPYDEEDKQQ
jgi:hypothetical protein